MKSELDAAKVRLNACKVKPDLGDKLEKLRVEVVDLNNKLVSSKSLVSEKSVTITNLENELNKLRCAGKKESEKDKIAIERETLEDKLQVTRNVAVYDLDQILKDGSDIETQESILKEKKAALSKTVEEKTKAFEVCKMEAATQLLSLEESHDKEIKALKCQINELKNQLSTEQLSYSEEIKVLKEQTLMAQKQVIEKENAIIDLENVVAA